MEVKDILKQKRIEKELTLDDVARIVGVSGATISRWESGDIANMRRDKIVGLANALGISPAVIMGWEEPSSSTDPQVYGSYRIPLVATVAAGIPIYSEENIEGYLDYDKDPKGAVFAAHVKGHSMEPKLMDGDTVIIDKEAAWNEGDAVLVTVNGDEGTIKKVKKLPDGVRLISINPAYDPIDYSAQQVQDLPVEVVGKVMESRRKW